MEDVLRLRGVAAIGESGVRICLELLVKEWDVTMVFCGPKDINEVDQNMT